MSNLPAHSETLHIRLTAADRAAITARATRASLTVSEYVRRSALGTLNAAATAPRQGAFREGLANMKGDMHKYLSSAGGDDPA